MWKITLRDVIEFLALPLLSAAVGILWMMNDNINRLNLQVGVIIAESGPVKEVLKDHEIRLRDLERELTKGK